MQRKNFIAPTIKVLAAVFVVVSLFLTTTHCAGHNSQENDSCEICAVCSAALATAAPALLAAIFFVVLIILFKEIQEKRNLFFTRFSRAPPSPKF